LVTNKSGPTKRIDEHLEGGRGRGEGGAGAVVFSILGDVFFKVEVAQKSVSRGGRGRGEAGLTVCSVFEKLWGAGGGTEVKQPRRPKGSKKLVALARPGPETA